MNILFVNACSRQNSRTKRLADYLLRQLHGTVRERNRGHENNKGTITTIATGTM